MIEEIIQEIDKKIKNKIKEDLPVFKLFIQDFFQFLYSKSFAEKPLIYFIIEKETKIKSTIQGDLKHIKLILSSLPELLEKKELIEINKKYNSNYLDEVVQCLLPVIKILKDVVLLASNLNEIKNLAKEGTKLGSSIIEAFQMLESIDVKRLSLIKTLSEKIKFIISEIETKGILSSGVSDLAINKKFKEIARLYEKGILSYQDVFELKLLNNELLFLNLENNSDFDIYIDTSSSMGETLSIGDIKLKKIDIAAAIAFYLSDQNKKIYQFSSIVKPVESNIFDFLLKVSPAGGTNLERVISHIEKTRKNGIIITDGEASIKLTSELVTFVVIGKKYNSKITLFNPLIFNG